MNRVLLAAFYSALFTMFGGSLFYLINIASAVATGGNVGQAALDAISGAFWCWVLMSVVFHQLLGLFDDLNKRGGEPRKENEGETKAPKSENDREHHDQSQ